MVERKWAKVINEDTKEVCLGVGKNPDYYSLIGMEEMEVEQAFNNRWYLKGYCPVKPEPTQEEIIKNEIYKLESQITQRNLRSALLNDEFALNKIRQIEEQIAELRKQLVELENK